MVEILLGPCIAGARFVSTAQTGLEERYVVPDAQRLGMRHRQRERLGQLAHGVQAPVLAVLLQDVLLRGGQQAEPLRRRAAGPLRPVEAVEETAADLVLLEHHGDRFVLVEGRTPVPPLV